MNRWKKITASKKRQERAYEKGRADGQREGEQRMADRARRDAAARYERLIMPEVDRGRAVVWIGDRPEQPVIRVALLGGLGGFEEELRYRRLSAGQYETALFECQSKAQQIELPGPGGFADPYDRRMVIVRWADWKFLRLE